MGKLPTWKSVITIGQRYEKPVTNFEPTGRFGKSAISVSLDYAILVCR
ncbi:MAG: hypothetical protein ACI9Z9_000438 [Litorivivens sp.]